MGASGKQVDGDQVVEKGEAFDVFGEGKEVEYLEARETKAAGRLQRFPVLDQAVHAAGRIDESLGSWRREASREARETIRGRADDEGRRLDSARESS